MQTFYPMLHPHALLEPFFHKNALLVKVKAFSKDFYKWLPGNLIRFNDVILLKRVQDIYKTEKKYCECIQKRKFTNEAEMNIQ